MKTLFQHLPALWTVLLFSAGLLLSHYFSLQPKYYLLTLGVSLILSLTSLLQKNALIKVLCGSLTILSLGFAFLKGEDYSLEHSMLNTLASHHPGKAIITGVVTSSEAKDARTVIKMKVASITCDSLYFSVEEKILLSLHDTASTVQVGDSIKCYGELQPLLAASNPWAYNYGLAVRRQQGVGAQCNVHSKYDLYVLGRAKEQAWWSEVERIGGVTRNWINTTLLRYMQDGTEAGFVGAVIIGTRSTLDQDTLDSFSRSGISHLLAISGFNVAIVAYILSFLFGMLQLRWRIVRVLLTMLSIVAYCVLVGLQPSVVRSLIMIELLLLSQLLERKPDTLNIVAGAALISLVIHPYDLFDIGFQLSYAAVVGLVVIYPELKRLFLPTVKKPSVITRFSMRMLEALLLSIAATVATLPVMIAHFNRQSVIGALVNLPAIPLAAIITILGFVLLACSWVSWLGYLYGEALSLLTKALLWLAHIAAKPQSSVVSIAAPRTWLYPFFILAVLFLIYSAGRKQLVGRAAIILSMGAVIFLLRVPLRASVFHSNALSVAVMDVGQGDCLLVRTPHGKSYFIDFGDVVGDRSEALYNVVPLLRAEGCSTIEGAFLTHLHQDHFGGFSDVAAESTVKTLYTSDEHTSSKAVFAFERALHSNHISTRSLQQGDRLQLDSDVTLYVLGPDDRQLVRHRALSSSEINHGSLVLKLCYGKTSALLLGDIESTDEERLVEKYGVWLKSDLVKVAHHGSKSSSTPSFVQAVAPSFAAISVGVHNHFGHPNGLVMNRWSHTGAAVHRTDREGALLFESDGLTFREVNWRQEQER